MAALLAQQNFVATREFLTAKDGGLYNAYVNGGNPDAAVADLGQRFELEQIALRLWPSATLIQGLNTALSIWSTSTGSTPRMCARYASRSSQSAFDMHGGFRTYKAKFEALLSAHYAAAVILHDRALTLAQFEPAPLRRSETADFAAEKVEVHADAAVTGSQAQRRGRDGRRHGACRRAASIRSASTENPLSRGQIEQQIPQLCARRSAPTVHIADVSDAIDRLEDFGSVRELMALLRPPPRPRAMAAAE